MRFHSCFFTSVSLFSFFDNSETPFFTFLMFCNFTFHIYHLLFSHLVHLFHPAPPSPLTLCPFYSSSCSAHTYLHFQHKDFFCNDPDEDFCPRTLRGKAVDQSFETVIGGLADEDVDSRMPAQRPRGSPQMPTSVSSSDLWSSWAQPSQQWRHRAGRRWTQPPRCNNAWHGQMGSFVF